MNTHIFLFLGAATALLALTGLGIAHGAGTAERKLEDLEAGIDTAGQGDDPDPQ